MDLAKILGGPESLEMLIEIGIEKLKRDYTQTMLNNTLATREDLAKIIEDQNEIVVLRKLHCIQCLICLCQTFLPSNQGLYIISKWEHTYIDSLDSIPSPSPSMKIQTGKFALSNKAKHCQVISTNFFFQKFVDST